MCPGEAHTLTIGNGVTINATTTGATANYPFCLNPPQTSPPASPDVVYAFTLMNAGTLSLSVKAATGSTLQPAIDIRSDCSMKSLFCIENGMATDTFDMYLAAGTYHAIVSGDNCTSGAFTLMANLIMGGCGDGVLPEGTKTCDPGPYFFANDGCNPPGSANQCTEIPAPASQDVCNGQMLAVPVGTTILPMTMGMSTYGFKDDYITTKCQSGTNGAQVGGKDRVFQLVPAASGTITVKVGYDVDGTTDFCVANMFDPRCWISSLYARSTCADANTELACSVGVNGGNIKANSISFPVVANTPYWVFVDGYDTMSYSYGPFNFIVQLQ
jgi:hypothetical protein